MAQAWQGKLEKLDNFRWKIPPSYKPGMKVPGLIYANESLLPGILNDKALEQVANVSFLPGIIQYSLAMPDIHWGYGFSIGGVAATDPENQGVISPGGVGYDINCLSCDTKIKMEHGYYLPIVELEEKWEKLNTVCVDFRNTEESQVSISKFIKIKPANKIYKITSEAGDEIIATGDHPFWTPDGMVKAGYLSIGSRIAISPFVGVKYEEPGNEIILEASDIERLPLKLKKDEMIKELKKRGLLPLCANDERLPYFLKIMGYHMGDGTMYVTKNKAMVWFYGQPEELELIRKDIFKLGYTPSRVYTRERKHKITTSYDTYEFTRKEYSIKVTSRSFLGLLLALGVPMGKKVCQPYIIPDWVFGLRKWQKRLFLAGLFDAELSSPKALYNYNFHPPCLSMNKEKSLIDNGIYFLQQISQLLEEFGVRIQKIGRRVECKSKNGDIHYRLRLTISSDVDNMINFYSVLGFEYNLRKKNAANTVLQYLKLKKRIIEERSNAEKTAVKFYQKGFAPQEIYKKLASKWVNVRFLERSLFEGRNTSPRTAFNFTHFIEYKKEVTEGLKNSCYLWDRILSAEEIDYKDSVYDLAVNHISHNFIANNFVVSNCGVRLVRSDLTLDDLKPKLQILVNELFNNIPSGVGSSGDIKASAKEEEEIFLKGAEWAIKKGYGVKEDLEFTEDKGSIEGADPSIISERAYERGKNQSGTLGSGNHFLEIQVIDEIYDEKKADAFGLFKGQVTMMIHSGSRGLGYQICDDYVKSMASCLGKYSINVPDRQLACAPVNSPEGKAYLASMKCAANYAWVNRQCLMHLARNVFEKVFNKSWSSLGLKLVYDVAHNIAKMEKHRVGGKEKILCVHRKGATRAFPPGHPDIPDAYREAGQPVIVPGDMGTVSYVLAGAIGSMEETFGSTCHGAGRCLSRSNAIKVCAGRNIDRELFNKSGIIVRAKTRSTLAEEAPEAYKDVSEVVDVVHGAGLSTKVARMRPLGVIKG